MLTTCPAPSPPVRSIAALTEATVSLLVGLSAGGAAAAYYALWLRAPLPPSLAALDAEFVLDLLLPPIIFHAGFSVKKKCAAGGSVCVSGEAGRPLARSTAAADGAASTIQCLAWLPHCSPHCFYLAPHSPPPAGPSSATSPRCEEPL